MNRINPLHVGGLLIMILIFLIFKLSGVKNELLEVKNDYKETLIIANELNELSKIYSDKQELKKSLNRVLRQSSLRSAYISKKFGKSSVVISSESMTQTAINSFMTKILNGSYNIVSFKIKRLSAKNVSLKMEIKW